DPLRRGRRARAHPRRRGAGRAPRSPDERQARSRRLRPAADRAAPPPARSRRRRRPQDGGPARRPAGHRHREAPDRVHARARVDPRRHDPAGRHARRPVPRRPRQPRPGPRAGDPAHRAAQPKELRRSPVHKVLAPALALTLAAASAHARTDAAAQPIAPGVAPVAPSANASVIGAPIIILPTWFWPYFVTSKCQFWDGTACTSADMANPYFKQILILPSGFADSERADFWTEFDKIRNQMATAGNVWSTQYRHKILWVGYFVPGGPLNTPTANFGAA